MNEYDLNRLEIEKMKKATEDLKQMQANFKKYGVYVTDKDIPESQTRQELYDRLDLSNVYKDIAAKQNDFKAEINRVAKDKRYKAEFKEEYKQKMQEEFIKYKTEKLTEAQAKLQSYKTDLQDKYSYKVEDPQLEATQTNNSLLELAFLDNMTNNTELIQQFVNDNWRRKGIISLVEAKYSDNASIVSQIANKRKEEQKPYELINSCLRDVDTFIANKDYIVNSDYIESGITKFNPIAGVDANEE